MAAGSSAGGGGGGGGGGVPPGFRFHPTDEELLHFYLKKKVSFQKFDMEVIREVDLNKVEPWELQERCKIGSTPQNEWYFFSHKDKKYPTGSRTNRATSAGFWKATGRDKCIRNNFTKIGMRKTLVFYRGRAPHGQKTDWIMHEYRLEDFDLHNEPPQPTEDGWVVCRVFTKKNLFKVGNSEVGSHHIHNNGTMMSDDQLNISSTCSAASPQSRSIFSQRNHAIMNNQHLVDHLAYPHLSVHPGYQQNQYSHQLQPQNLMSSTAHNHMIKPQMLNDYNTSTDYTAHCPPQSVPGVMARTMQVKQFMSSSDDHCESAATCGFETTTVDCDHESTHQLMPRGDDQNLNQWEDDRLVIVNSPNQEPAAETNPNQINQLSLRSEMDFWAYGK